MTSHVRYIVQAPFATLTLDRPSARNAYSDAMIDGFVRALDQAQADDQVAALIVTGAGSAFCAGGDLLAMRERSGMFAGDAAALRTRYLTGIQRVPRRLATFDKPVIAAINGPAIGAGLDLACMCDLRVAATSARFASSFVKLGLVPGDGGAYFLARIVGFPRALELALTGRTFDAQEALGMGLVFQVVNDDDLSSAAEALAGSIAGHPATAVRLTKAALYRAWEQSLDQALDLAATYQAIAQRHPDHEAALRALDARARPGG